MSDTKLLIELYEELYDELKDHIEKGDNPHKAYVFRQPPNNAIYPHIQFPRGDSMLADWTQDYQENKYQLSFLLNIYTDDRGSADKNEVAKVLEIETSDFFKNKGFKIQSIPAFQLDTKFYRVQLRVTGLYDTKTRIIKKQ